MGRTPNSSRNVGVNSLEMRLRFSPTSSAFKTTCRQKEGAIAVSGRLKISATGRATEAFSSGKHQVTTTEASMTNHRCFSGFSLDLPSLIRSFILSPRNESLSRLPKLDRRSTASAAETPWSQIRSFNIAPSNLSSKLRHFLKSTGRMAPSNSEEARVRGQECPRHTSNLGDQKFFSPKFLNRVPQLSRLLKFKPLGRLAHIAL